MMCGGGLCPARFNRGGRWWLKNNSLSSKRE
jgi:hypothetical protein